MFVLKQSDVPAKDQANLCWTYFNCSISQITLPPPPPQPNPISPNHDTSKREFWLMWIESGLVMGQMQDHPLVLINICTKNKQTTGALQRNSDQTRWIGNRCTIVNGGDWLWSPANIKGANKDAKIYVRRSTTLHNLLFCVHTLCMNYVTSTFLLVSSSVRSKQLLCFVQGQGQKREQKHTTKNFVGFHNHSLY